MPAYAITVTCVVAASSVIVFLIFYRMKVLNFRTLFSVTLASLITALGLPALFSAVSSGMDGSFEIASPLIVLMVSIAAYLLIVVILSLIISFIINGTGSKQKKRDASEDEDQDKASAEDDNYLEQIFVNFIGGQEQSGTGNNDLPIQTAETDDTYQNAAHQADSDETGAISNEPQAAAAVEAINDTIAADMSEEETAEIPETPVEDSHVENFSVEDSPVENFLFEEIPVAQEPSDAVNDTILPDSDGILANIDENAATVENNLEISVDSNENIDKMGIENIVQNRNSLTIEDCINEAFRLKGAGDFESAILYHMYALDKKPGKELTFWIILDIC